jgi:5'-nucleotidase / UDP-sugar diphosphatase
MRYFNTYFTTIGIVLLLYGTNLTAQTCAPATFQQDDLSVNIPCVQLDDQQFQLKLNFDEQSSNPQQGYHWRLEQFQANNCIPNLAQCGRFDRYFNLSLPMINNEQEKYRINLHRSMSDQNQILWQFISSQPVDSSDIIKLTQINPNPNGAFTQLYAISGDLVNGFDRVYKDFIQENNLVLPQKKLAIGQEMELIIYHFNDLHNNLRVVSGARGNTHYFSQMAKIVREARAKAANNPNQIVLFLSAGDDHIGNPLDELLGYDENSFKASAAYTAYSAAGLDASVIGNHELDKGAALLAKMISANANFPVLSANLYGSKYLTHEHYFPAVIGVANDLRIGIIGITTEQETLLRTTDDPSLDSGDILQTLRNTMQYVDELADVIILLTHVGYNGALPGEQMIRHELEIGDVEIAKTAASLTNKPLILIGGHGHLNLNDSGLLTTVAGVPILQAKAKGSHLGEAKLDLLQTAHGLRYQLTSKLIPMKNRDKRVLADDPKYNTLEQDGDYDAEFEATVMAPLYAALEQTLQEVLAVSGSAIELTTEETFNDRYVGESAIANFMNDAIVARSELFPYKDGQSQKVDIAAFNASGVNAGIELNREINFNDWYEVMPFADMIIILQMSGEQLKQMVMSNAQRIVRPEEIADLNLGGYISRGFLHFSSGLRYDIKLNADASQAVAENITFNGEPIENLLQHNFKIAFGDYIALRGAEGWNGDSIRAGLAEDIRGMDIRNLPKNDTGLVYRNEIIAYIRQHGRIDASTGAHKDGRIRIF